jgi:hypothetical protein
VQVGTRASAAAHRQPAVPIPSLTLLWRPVAIYLASRIGVLLVVGGVAYVKHSAVQVALLDWDSRWYLRVAAHGYPHAVPAGTGPHAQSRMGFFPLLPLLIRLVHVLTRLPFGDAGLVVSGIAGLAAAMAVWTLLFPGNGAGGADRGTALLLFSPAAFVLSMVYSEPLLIAFGAGTLLCLRRHRWLPAGVLAGLMTATDPLGVAIVVPCLMAAWPAVRRRADRWAVVAPVLSLCGIGAFAVYLWVHTGSPFSYLTAQRRGWQYGHVGAGIPLALRYLVEHGTGNPNYVVKAVSTLIIAAAVLYLLRRRPPLQELGYLLAVLVLAAASPQVAWSPRVALRAFPLLGRIGSRLTGGWFAAVLGLSALALAGLTIISLGGSRLPFTP